MKKILLFSYLIYIELSDSRRVVKRLVKTLD